MYAVRQRKMYKNKVLQLLLGMGREDSDRGREREPQRCKLLKMGGTHKHPETMHNIFCALNIM